MRLVLLAALVVLTGCSDDYEAQQAGLQRYVAGHKVGTSSDVYLRKLNMIGDWEPVALIFGMSDDMAFCVEVAEAYMQQYPASQYKCTVENS